MNLKKKIIVIADDFTGAAEIGGIGLRHGLKVAIETEPINNNEVDLLIIATDTRSMQSSEAAKYIYDITKIVLSFDPLFVFKKIDSVLRGNISEELYSQLKASEKKKAIIIAANPVFERTIKSGKYFIKGIPLHKSRFSTDSQYPILSNNVLKILKPISDFPIVNRKFDDILPEKGLIIGDVENLDDLRKWSLKYKEDFLFAGASGFFNSLLITLQLSKQKKKSQIKPFGERALFVLGSSYPKDKEILNEMIKNDHFHSNMPEEIYKCADYPSYIFENWVKEVIQSILRQKKVIVSSIHSNSNNKEMAVHIKKTISKLVKRVFEKTDLDEILIEGGSTTSEILKKLNIKHLTPFQELDTGVIRMQVDKKPDLYLTTKPGSYLWPENVWIKNKISNLNKEILLNIPTNE